MMSDFINPTADPMHENDVTGMTHRTARQTFGMRREIENTRRTIGSYEAAAKKVLVGVRDDATGSDESHTLKTDYYKDIRQSLGIKADDTKRNPYTTGSRNTRGVVGRRSEGDNAPSANAKTGGLAIPERPVEPTFREPQPRSYNPFG